MIPQPIPISMSLWAPINHQKKILESREFSSHYFVQFLNIQNPVPSQALIHESLGNFYDCSLNFLLFKDALSRSSQFVFAISLWLINPSDFCLCFSDLMTHLLRPPHLLVWCWLSISYHGTWSSWCQENYLEAILLEIVDIQSFEKH